MAKIRNMTIMMTCIGRRVSLVNAFRRAGIQTGIGLKVIGTDTSVLCSAMQRCDTAVVVRPINKEGYLHDLLAAVRKYNIGLVIPTIDLDLQLLADNRRKFEKLGCTVLVSSPEVVTVCQDKRLTFKFLKKHGFATPETITPAAALAMKNLKYPVFLKPWDGHASRLNAVAHNRAELKFYYDHISHCMVQEFVEGQEFTCDVFVDFNMRVRCVVPRMRLEVRSGEVSKGKIVKDERIMQAAGEVVHTIKAGPGLITVQLIHTAYDGIKFIEINPRFGGGAPLSIRAGANFPKWILQQMFGIEPQIKFNGFKDGLVMLRYDAEVWVNGK